MMAIFNPIYLLLILAIGAIIWGLRNRRKKASTPLIVVGGILIGLILLLFLLEFLGLIE